ncbi:epidermal growth factor-like protein 8 [Trichonephila clavipes]|nr:epidermal growth factor-like protein 8 [Trichonephila clavipes]
MDKWPDLDREQILATRRLLATDHVILNHGQVTWTTPELAPPLLTTTPHQREDVSALDRFNVHRCPTRWVFSGTGLELVTSACHRAVRLAWAKDHRDWSDESRFRILNIDGKLGIWRQTHEAMDPACQVGSTRTWWLNHCLGCYFVALFVIFGASLSAICRHVCTQNKVTMVPVKEMQSYCKPAYQSYLRRCDKEISRYCSGYRVVYELAYRSVQRLVAKTESLYSCCPGWTQTRVSSSDCKKGPWKPNGWGRELLDSVVESGSSPLKNPRVEELKLSTHWCGSRERGVPLALYPDSVLRGLPPKAALECVFQ